MPWYELVREIQNSCPNNQMRDVSFQEVETEDPEGWVRQMLGARRWRCARRREATALWRFGPIATDCASAFSSRRRRNRENRDEN